MTLCPATSVSRCGDGGGGGLHGKGGARVCRAPLEDNGSVMAKCNAVRGRLPVLPLLPAGWGRYRCWLPHCSGREVESLWQEYDGASSSEALLVKDFDKLEMIITAHQYEQVRPVDGVSCMRP